MTNEFPNYGLLHTKAKPGQEIQTLVPGNTCFHSKLVFDIDNS